MNTEQHINRFDELIREKLDNYELEPDMDLLVNIHARKTRFMNSRNLLTLMILIVILTAGIIGGYFYNGSRLKENTPSNTDSSVLSQDRNNGKGILHGFGNTNQPGTYFGAHTLSDAAFVNGTPANYTAYSTLLTSSANSKGRLRQQDLTADNATGRIKANHASSSANHRTALQANTNQASHTAGDGKRTENGSGNGKTKDDLKEQAGKDREKEQENKAQQDESGCNASFEYYTSYNDAFHFLSNTGGGTAPVKLKWSFGDGTTSTEINPVHTYTKPGQYAVTLTTLNTANNCKAEVYKLVRVIKGVELTSSTLRGTVFADAEYAGKIMVQLIEHNSKQNTYEVVQSTLTNAKGQYEFSDIIAGNFLIRAASYKTYFSTFYGNSTDQEYATDVTIFENDYKVLNGYDIQLANNRPLSGNPVVKTNEPGSRIMIIIDENNQPMYTVVVSGDGGIDLPVNLPTGDYKLLDPSTGKIDGGIRVDASGTASRTQGSGSGNFAGAPADRELALAPNPANNYVKVSLSNATGSNVEITIINGNGSMVQQYNLPGGNYVNTLDINHLPPGTYYIMARQDGAITTSTLVKASDNGK